MKPSEREMANLDFLSGSFVSIPYVWMLKSAELGLGPAETVILLHIFAAHQVEQKDFLTPPELAERCGISPADAAGVIERLVTNGFLSIGERLDEQGTHSNYFDLKPLWTRIRGKDPLHTPTREWRKDAITLFEEEFGRPLSGLECEQVRQWLERDGHPEWMIVEALREAVLANKYSFKYIDRVLYDWFRNRIRTKAELEAYRQSYRERAKGKEETAATSRTSTGKTARKADAGQTRDDRYSAFYQLFPDA